MRVAVALVLVLLLASSAWCVEERKDGVAYASGVEVRIEPDPTTPNQFVLTQKADPMKKPLTMEQVFAEDEACRKKGGEAKAIVESYNPLTIFEVKCIGGNTK